ncbi:MAG: hypothetical protein MI784_03160, partial [Cytophagales bacterium]|nr:hypothetical protein [Cytophagales bacterium]
LAPLNDSERLEHFTQTLENLPGARSFARRSPGEKLKIYDVAPHMANGLYSVNVESCGNTFTRSKLLKILNYVGDIESHSIAMRLVKQHEDSDVSAVDADFLALANKYRDSNPRKSLSLLAAIQQPDSFGSRPSKALAHALKIQCEDSDCLRQVGYGKGTQYVKECVRNPTLKEKLRLENITPFSFSAVKAL